MLLHKNDLKADRQPPSFEDTKIAFSRYTDSDLQRAYWLFKIINNNFLVKVGPALTNIALKIGLPIKGLIKATIFKHFCGGETIVGCNNTIKNLAAGGVGTILDYSVEGEDSERVFDATCNEILRTVDRAADDKSIPITVFKVTGVGRFDLLEKLEANQALTITEQQEWQKVYARVKSVCEKAYQNRKPVMIDAEESWIQNTIDELALNMMRLYNKKRVIVYNTYQLYRRDKLEALKHDFEVAEKEGFILGAKLVRGAYMEKERKRAIELSYASPIQQDKASTDRDYNEAIRFCIAHIDRIAMVAGTHNEQSCRLLTELMHEHDMPHNHKHVYYSQLLGMSDNLSFNLASAKYNVAKYVPYGPIKAVLPYLFRRAEENTAISGQMSRELSLIIKEKKRRGI